MNKLDDNKVKALLRELGIPQHLKGYSVINETIKMVVGEPQLIEQISKRLYPEVAEKMGTTASQVERAIRYAKEIAYMNAPLNLLEKIFGHTVSANKDVPCNAHFIAAVVDYMEGEDD